LIDKDGTIYQVVPIKKKCWHVAPIKSRCRETHSCTRDEQVFQANLRKQFPNYGQFTRELAKHEWKKSYPERYPGNEDAIGIEVVGRALKRTPKDPAYEPLTPPEQRSLQWLIQALLEQLHLKRTDIYRHPDVGYKTAGEAADAKW
jgi:N-acetyl-anhydromuramyl-L-alanine amidase AmpD